MVKRKDKKIHAFWKRIHFKYKVYVINENTLEEVTQVRASLFWGSFMVFLFAVFLIVTTSIIIITTPIRNYLPGYLNSEIRAKAMSTAIRVDSLEQALNEQDAYIHNIKDVFAGKIDPSAAKSPDTIRVSVDDKSLKQTDLEKSYTDKFESDEKYNLSAFPTGTDAPSDGISFFRPTRGVISEKYNSSQHRFGIELTTAAKESVLATLEGKVIFVGYNPQMGYTIQIQHKNGFVSIYRHNALLLKEVGDVVRTSEAIAVVDGSADDHSGKSYLEFELWYKGNPVNPETYISF